MARMETYFVGALPSMKKVITGLMVVFLISVNLYLQVPFIPMQITSVSGEMGAPPENGTTTVPWQVNASDLVIRDDEIITTREITVNGSGIMFWQNVTATIKDDVNVKGNGIFDLTECNISLVGYLNCSGLMNWNQVEGAIVGDLNVNPGGILNLTDSLLVLTGDLIISGTLNLINSTIITNCSTAGEFFILVNNNGEFDIRASSNISAPSFDNRIRVLYVSSDSKFTAENSNFSFIGLNNKFSGLTIEANDTKITGCNFYNCNYALNLLANSGALIENCTFFNNTIGLNISGARENTIQNCEFYDNVRGIQCENSNMITINNSRLLNNSEYGLALVAGNYGNTINDSNFKNNQWSGILIENNSVDNHIINCEVRNNHGLGIHLKDDSNNNTMIGCSIVDNGYNVKSENDTKGTLLVNCDLPSVINLNFLITNSSELTALNTTFNRTFSEVDSDSNLTTQWYLDVYVQNSTFVPIQDVNISVWDNENGSFISQNKTNATGWYRGLICTEYYETNYTIVNLTPHSIQMWKFGYNIYFSELLMNSSKLLNVTMDSSYVIDPDLVPLELLFSEPYPRNNQLLKISTQISNVGNIDFDNTNRNVTVQFLIDNEPIKTFSNISSIPVLGVIDLEFDWRVNVSKNGTHNISVVINPDWNITELNHNNNSLSKEIIINSIPVAILSIDTNRSLTMADISFLANKSYNEVQEVWLEYYLFDFGDGSNSDWITVDRTIHQYTDDGLYNVRVQVRDMSGQVSPWSTILQIEVLNRAPMANFSIFPSSGWVTSEFMLNAAISTDLDGTITSYYWEFPEGANRTNSTESQPIVKFEDDIEYGITLTVWDDDGVRSELSKKTIKVQNLAPQVYFEIEPGEPHVDEKIIFNASATVDLDDEEYPLYFTWDFGDGTFAYRLNVIQHTFTAPGIYNVTLYAGDDDRDTGIYWLEINVTTASPEDNVSEEADLFWVVVLVAAILVIFFILIMLVFITQSKKLNRKFGSLGKQGSPVSGMPASTDDEFTTAGKLDFVILKKPVGKRYIKFELHRTTRSNTEFVGLIWKSAFLDGSWTIMDKMLGTKDRVVDELQLKILTYTNKNWKVDYGGNGIIQSKPKMQPSQQLAQPVEPTQLAQPTEPVQPIEPSQPTAPTQVEAQTAIPLSAIHLGSDGSDDETDDTTTAQADQADDQEK